MALGMLLAFSAPSAMAAFGFSEWNFELPSSAQGGLYTQAGGHPYQIVTNLGFNSHENYPDEAIRDVLVDLPPGFVGNPTVLPECTAQQMVGPPPGFEGQQGIPTCPIASQVGYVRINSEGTMFSAPLYNVVPATGEPARFAFNVLGTIVNLDAALRQGPPLHLAIDSKFISQQLPLVGVKVVFWGVPADASHDDNRCQGGGFYLLGSSPFCIGSPGNPYGPHAAGTPSVPFLSMPTKCNAPEEGLHFDGVIDSWDHPGVFDFASFATSEPPPGDATERGAEGCDVVPSDPNVELQPTGQSAQSPTGLNVQLSVPTEGILNPEGIAQSHLKKVTVKLPEGMSLNPSQGEGLGVCTPAQLAQEAADAPPGQGCPSTSKLGSVELRTPLLKAPLPGSIYLAQPDNVRTTAPGSENPFDSLVALYLVVKDPDSGILLKLPGKVEGDQRTGQLTTSFDDLPQFPFTSFTLHFREGARSPLVTPSACGTYTSEAEFVPYANPNTTIKDASSFRISSGIGGGPCPAAATPSFKPQLDAGAINSNAGSFSPFYVRMFRSDADQEITNFSADLPPGVAAVLAGVPKCSDAELAQTAAHTGVEEQTHPACPAQSQVGRVLTGFGVGSSLTYAPGKVYLAGPYHGTPVSIATVAPATVGPFDLGTVVVRSAFRVDPETAQVHIDSKGSDPIPHILRGFPLRLRDIRIYIDRPHFTTNPTNCNPMSVGALLTGSGASFADSGDDLALPITEPFQVSNCALLPFKPKLSFKLKGGTHRGDFPALTATLKARPGDANIARAVVALPHSEFLAQEHIGTICTRVQFAADQCPAASIYGRVQATTPLLDAPLRGPVYLRSSENPLPDLVAKLSGEININLVGRIDSINEGIRTTFDTVPDTPVTKFTLRMGGAKKGLFVNSRNLCLAPSRADARFIGQNGKVFHARPKMANSCARTHGKKHHKRG
jgi:hypothetical protein